MEFKVLCPRCGYQFNIRYILDVYFSIDYMLYNDCGYHYKVTIKYPNCGYKEKYSYIQH